MRAPAGRPAPTRDAAGLQDPEHDAASLPPSDLAALTSSTDASAPGRGTSPRRPPAAVPAVACLRLPPPNPQRGRYSVSHRVDLRTRCWLFAQMLAVVVLESVLRKRKREEKWAADKKEKVLADSKKALESCKMYTRVRRPVRSVAYRETPILPRRLSCVTIDDAVKD